MNRLTTAFLLSKKNIGPVVVNHCELIHDLDKPYYLLIVSTNLTFTKLTIYPSEFDIIAKVIIRGSNLNETSVYKIAQVLNKFEIVHTSGLVAINTSFLYEMYIAGNFGTKQEIAEYYYRLKKIPGVDSLEEEWIQSDDKTK